MKTTVFGLTLKEWRSLYRDQGKQPADVLAALHDALLATDGDPAWILLFDWPTVASQLDALSRHPNALDLPLYGIPFAIKDNIDYAGQATTAACPAFAYNAQETATAVQQLLDAGAVVIGKTNLDQFASGLVGTRSPFGAVPNAFDPDYVSGGSSSGSASVVARGLVPFALGTDTAGSGRVPAGFNNLVGLKPTRGSCSTLGVVPACRSLDCVSVFALNVEDAWEVYDLMSGFDARDPFSRQPVTRQPVKTLPDTPRLGIPMQLEWYGDKTAEKAWQANLEQLADMGAELVSIDFSPLLAAARLLYTGPWLAERYYVIEKLLDKVPDEINPVVRDIIAPAADMSAVDAFAGEYQLAALKRKADALIDSVDALLVPTSPTIPRTEDVNAEPIAKNSQLGQWTNFVNLLDWCALALPGGFREDGLPCGITLIGPAWQDYALSHFALRWQQAHPWKRGATGKQPGAAPDSLPLLKKNGDDAVRVAVVGAHLTGMPLNFQLTTREAVLVEQTQTADCYRLYALANTSPPKPGLVKAESGAPIEIEIWEMPMHRFGEFVAEIPAPLGIGTLQLADGRTVKSFICEPAGLDGACDITELGGWRAYINQQAKAASTV